MRSASLCAWFKELHFNFAAQPSLRAWLSCFFTGGTQRKTAAAALVSYGNSLAAGRLSADINTIFENCDNRKRTAIPGKTHVQQSFFLHQRELTELFAAHDTPVCPRHSQTAGINGIATHQGTLSTATPKRPAVESPVSKVLCIPCAVPKKQRQTACLHAPQAVIRPATKFL